MKAVFVFCFCFTILVSTDARPPTINRLLSGLAAIRQRRTDISSTPSCQLASQALGQLLDHAQQTMAGMYLSHANIVLNFDVNNAEEREDVICQLSDLGTLSALYDTVDDLGMLDHLIRREYNYISVTFPMNKIHILHFLDNVDDYSWIEPEELQIGLNLYNTLESTGLLDHDHEGKNLIYEVYTEYINDFLDGYSPEPLSDEPLQSQTNKLTNDIRKVWNLYVKRMTEWNREELRHNIKEWTGLVIGRHNDMKAIVSDVLEAASNSGLQGIIDVVKEYDVPRHLLKKAYSLLMENIDWMMADLEAASNPPSYNDIYGSYGYGDYQDYQAIMAQINGDLIELFSRFRDMGLLNLEDDL